MEIYRSDTRVSRRAPGEWFIGSVWQDPIIEASAPARVRALRVTFAPGARTAWHTHPVGQTLHVLQGLGLTQSRGGPLRSIRPGDTVWIAPGEEHWHGATPQTTMVHLAIQEADESGTTANWLEQVNESDYTAVPEAA
ncbi:MAG: cupin domain-containing protein [Geminicoccaceae bacterium]|jgi:quercetin dioxygenase-like cupin family protein